MSIHDGGKYVKTPRRLFLGIDHLAEGADKANGR